MWRELIPDSRGLGQPFLNKLTKTFERCSARRDRQSLSSPKRNARLAQRARFPQHRGELESELAGVGKLQRAAAESFLPHVGADAGRTDAKFQLGLAFGIQLNVGKGAHDGGAESFVKLFVAELGVAGVANLQGETERCLRCGPLRGGASEGYQRDRRRRRYANTANQEAHVGER